MVPQRLPMNEECVFDLASLTKPIVTATLVMTAIEKGLLHEEDKITSILPEAGLLRSVTISDLLVHRSGLPSWLPLYKSSPSKTEILARLFEIKPESVPRKLEVYSDLGYMILGAAVERVFLRDLNHLSHEMIFSRLGMLETCYLPSPELAARAAATELSENGTPLVGIVHDENARAMGGVSGHAGLFSTAADLLVFAQMMLDFGKRKGIRLLEEHSVLAMTSNMNEGIGGHYGHGWVTRKPDNIFPDNCSPESFGHTGFTGTCIGIDRKTEAISILLTNAVHPKRREKSINEYRRRVFELTIELVKRAR